MAGAAEAVYAQLSGFSALTALVGTRIYPVEAPANAVRPYVVFFTVSNVRVNHLSGPAEVTNPRLQIDGYAARYIDAQAIAEQVRAALDGFAGTSGGVEVLAVTCIDGRDFYEDSANPPLHRASLDFSLWHRTV